MLKLSTLRPAFLTLDHHLQKYITKQEFIAEAEKIWKNNNQHLYRCDIKSNILSTPASYRRLFESFADNYKAWFSSIDIENYEYEVYIANNPDIFYIDFENFIKLLWLCDVLLEDGKFKNPLGVAYHPYADSFEVHPGGTRRIALHLFTPDYVDCFLFDVNKVVKSKPKNTFKNLNRVQCSELFPEYMIAFVPDLGTLVPHIMKGTETIATFKREYALKVKERLNNLKVKSNVRIPFLRDFFSSTPNTIITFYKQNIHPDDMLYHKHRATVLALLGKTFKDQYIKVEVVGGS